jgi:hypothetical protein
MTPKILFIGDKWCGGRKEFGISEWDQGMQNSLRSTGLAQVDTFDVDDYYINTGKKSDEAVLEKIKESKPDFIYYISNKMPSSSAKVIEFSTLKKIKDELKVPLVALFGDLAVNEQVKISRAMLPYAKLLVATELTAALARINRPDKYMYMWVPRDPRIFNNPNKVRDVEVGYVGSPRKNRLEYLLYLAKNGINVKYGGGEGHEHLSVEQYTDRYKRSIIALSFARSHSSHVVNARPFEAILCGSMLLEQENFELMKLYVPYQDYVPYNGKKDMLKKAKYYLEHNEEREKIALSGQRKTEQLYSAKTFWQAVIERTLGPEKNYVLDNSFPEGVFAHLSSFVSFKMKFLNWICGSWLGFAVYKIFNFRYWLEMWTEIWHHVFFVPIGKIKPFLQRRMSGKTFNFILKIKRKLIKTH